MSKKGSAGGGGGGGGGGGKHPLFEAINAEDLSAVAPLLPGADLEVKNKDGFTPLILASYVGAQDIVEALLSAGANPRAACKDGDTPLHYACAQGHLSIIALLGKIKGVQLEATDKDGETPADVAANGKCKKLMEKLIEERAAADEEEGEGGEEEEEAEEA
jgi:ankyrin repeat protein